MNYERSKLNNFAMSVAMGAGIGLGIGGAAIVGLSVASESPNEFIMNQPDSRYDLFSASRNTLAGCVTVDLSSIEDTRAIVDAPQNPDINNQYDSFASSQKFSRSLNTASTYNHNPQRTKRPPGDLVKFNIAHNSAEKHGLTLHDAWPYLEKLKADIDKIEMPQANTIDVGITVPQEVPLSLDNYLTTARDYFSLFDVSLEIQHPQNTSDRSLRHFDTLQTRKNIQALLENFTYYPQEYTRFSGLKKIALTNIEPNEKGELLPGYYAGPGTIVFNMKTGVGSHVIAHEMAHAGDDNFCGDAGIDPIYKADNAPGTYHTEGYVSSEKTYEGYKKELELVRQKMFHSRDAGLSFMSCSYQEQIRDLAEEAKTITLISDYSHTNSVEDKAEIGAEVTKFEKSPVLHDGTPLIKNKFIILLDRMTQDNPGLPRYFMDIKEHVQTDPAKVLLAQDCAAFPELSSSSNK